MSRSRAELRLIRAARWWALLGLLLQFVSLVLIVFACFFPVRVFTESSCTTKALVDDVLRCYGAFKRGSFPTGQRRKFQLWLLNSYEDCVRAIVEGRCGSQMTLFQYDEVRSLAANLVGSVNSSCRAIEVYGKCAESA
ncbi:hypothetical protein MRX96_010484 [Rhipicephalus microplus]